MSLGVVGSHHFVIYILYILHSIVLYNERSVSFIETFLSLNSQKGGSAHYF